MIILVETVDIRLIELISDDYLNVVVSIGPLRFHSGLKDV